MQLPILLIVFFLFSMYIRYLISSSKSVDADEQLKEDIDANFARVKDIDTNLFVKPDLSILPFHDNIDATEYPRVARSEISVLEKSKETMIRPDDRISNVDIKLQFGLANLEVVAKYEANFNQYVWALMRWAEALYQKDMLEEAIIVLRHSIDFGSEASKAYTMLGDIYHNMQDSNNIKSLLSEVESKNLDSKDIIVQHLENLLTKL